MTLLPSSAMNVDRFEKGPREILNPEIQKVPTHTCQSTSHVVCSVNYYLFLLWFVVLLHNHSNAGTVWAAVAPESFAFVEMCAANQRPLSAAFR